MDAHNERTKALAAKVRSFHDRKQPFRVYHGGTTSTRRTVYRADQSVDTSSFDHVLSVDVDKLRAVVEPNVNMGKLVDATLPYGLVPEVVPEFVSITVGGCFAGTGGESSSFRHGLFDDTIAGFEIILADGTIMTASEDEHADLFRGAAGSFGTLGVLTLLHVRLVSAKAYIEMEYHPVTDAASAVRKIEELTEDQSVWYLDGILYSPQNGVIMAGRFVDDATQQKVKPYTFHRRRDEWFYLHVQKRLKTHAQWPSAAGSDAKKSIKSSDSNDSAADSQTSHNTLKDIIPTKDYLFRYDRAGFWVAACAFKYFYIHNRRFQRWMLNPLCTTKTMLHAVHKAGLVNQFVVQDISMPYQGIPEFVEYLHQEVGIYPLWLCPLKVVSKPLSPRDPDIKDRVLNIGLWGQGSRKLDEFIAQNRRIEQKTRELHGLKCMYAQIFCSEDEFWEIYDREKYEAVRSKYGAQSLPSVYDKVGKNSAIEELRKRQSSAKERRKGHIKDFWIVRGVYGAASMLLGGNYLLKR